MTAKQIAKQVERALRRNSSSILSTMAVTGTLATTALAIRDSFVAAEVIRHDEGISGVSDDPVVRFRERTKLVWKLYVPTGVSATVTIGCVVASQRIDSKRTAALTAAYAIADKAYGEYREKVVETLGATKEQALRDELAQSRVNQTFGGNEVIVADSKVMCMEMYTGRYFASTMEELRRALNDINMKILHNDAAYLGDLYHILGLSNNEAAWAMGWTSDRLLDFDYSTALTEDGKPCITVSFNYLEIL